MSCPFRSRKPGSVPLPQGNSRSHRIQTSLADIGAGTGLFLEPIAKAAGDKGTLLAVDISEAFMKNLKKRVEGLKLCHVRAGKEVSTSEIKAAGFELQKEVTVKGF